MLALAFDSLFNPRTAIHKVLALPYGRQVFLIGAALLACVSALVNGLLAPMIGGGAPQPFADAIQQLVLIAILIFGVDVIGRFFGGKGDLDGALRVVVWHGVVQAVSIAIVLFAGLLVGPVVNVVIFVLLFWLFYVLAVFVQELHGFDSLLMTILGLIGACVVVGIPVMLLLASMGLLNLEGLG